MELFYRKAGNGKPLIIIHGLFGQSDNWNTLAKQFSENNLEVYTIDQRNHGLSPHSSEWNYKVMAGDLKELIEKQNIQKPVIIGHSMGGKTAMQFAIDHEQLLDKLIVADISPKYYPLHHQQILKGLNAIDFNVVKTRRDAADILKSYIGGDEGTVQFLLKNIYWKNDDQLDWRFNLKTITENIEVVGEATPNSKVCNTPTLFMRGEKSRYILDEDIDLIKKIFPHSTVKTIENSGHWIHAEKPDAFFNTVMEFIK